MRLKPFFGIAPWSSGEPSLQHGQQVISIAAPFPRITVADACRRYLGVDILAALDVANLTDTFKERGWHFSESDSWDELFHRLWVGQVEPKLNAEHPVYFLTEYPAPLQPSPVAACWIRGSLNAPNVLSVA